MCGWGRGKRPAGRNAWSVMVTPARAAPAPAGGCRGAGIWSGWQIPIPAGDDAFYRFAVLRMDGQCLFSHALFHFEAFDGVAGVLRDGFVDVGRHDRMMGIFPEPGKGAR